MGTSHKMLEAEEEFRKYHDRLRQELNEAAWNFNIAKYISDMTNGYLRELNQAPAFWNLTIKAHLFSALIHLNNLFGKRERQKFLHMHSFLEFISENLDIFSREAFERRLRAVGRYDELAAEFDPVMTTEKVQKDIEKLKELPISSLKSWRNKVLSHIDIDDVKQGISIATKHPIRTRHIQEIIDTLNRMLNEYELAYDFSTLAIRLPVEDGIKHILEAVKLKVETNRSSRLMKKAS